MKKNNILWAVLPMMAAALMTTACSNDDNVNESPAQQSTVKTIPYSVTVNDGVTTRATVDSDNKTLKFAAGDKLYITGTNIKGTLDIQTGTGTTSATFSGDLTYSGEGSPAADLELTATLVSAQQTNGTEVTINSTTNAVTVNYPTAAYCADVATAVQKYSNLTGTSTYGAKSFTLTQQTAFLNFVIYFTDGTTTGSSITATVNNGSDAYSASVTTTTDTYGNVVAKFVLPVAKNTTLSSATVKIDSKDALTISNATLDGKVYNVSRGYYGLLSTAANASNYGQVVCSDGKLYPKKTAVPAGCTAIGIVGKVTETGHGLILALQDAPSQNWNTIDGWGSLTFAGTTLKQLPDGTRGSLPSLIMLPTLLSDPFIVSNWCVAQKSDYEAIFQNLGSAKSDKYGYSYDSNVNAYITTGVGGAALDDSYWSATGDESLTAWFFYSDWWSSNTKTVSYNVRPVLGF